MYVCTCKFLRLGSFLHLSFCLIMALVCVAFRNRFLVEKRGASIHFNLSYGQSTPLPFPVVFFSAFLSILRLYTLFPTFLFFLFQSENKPVVQKTYYKNHSHIFSFFLLSFPLKTLPRGGGSIFCGEFNSFLIPELCCYTLLLRTIKKSWYTAAKLS